MRKKSYPVVNVGTASILVIFIILTLVTFATLSLLSANTNYGFSTRTAENTTAYYTACNQAERKLEAIDQRLKDPNWLASSSGNPAQLLAELDVTVTGNTLSFSLLTRQDFALFVELTLAPPAENQGRHYRITRWQEQSTTPWQGDQRLQLLE